MGSDFQTRNLAPYAITRTTMEKITLVFSDKVFKDDGSFETLDDMQEISARVIALTSAEIQRLVEGGVTINSGVSISLVGELAKVPDYIILTGSELMRIIRYTFEQGVSVMVCDMLPGVE